jgi:hypothetical protein
VSLAALLLAMAAAASPPVRPDRDADGAASRGAPSALEQAIPREVKSRLLKAQPRLGEPFDWEIEVRHAPDESYALPARLELPPLQVTPLGCRRAPAADRRERPGGTAADRRDGPGGTAGGDATTTCTLRLTLFELGARDLPTLRLEAATPAGPRLLDVPGPRVEAAGVIDPTAPPESLKLRDPAPAVPLLLPTWRPVWAALALLALVALGWAAWRWWRLRRARLAEPPAPLPPAERFARRLDALQAERLPEQGRAREHFFRLSEAVREYVGALTGVNALDLTTGELVDALRAGGDPRLDVAALRRFCEDADLVKFARAPAGGHECDAGLRFARDLLERTRPTLDPAPASKADRDRGRP